MATSITKTAIVGTGWTQLSTTETNVTINNNTGKVVFIAAAAADPTIGSANYATVKDEKALALGSLTLPIWARFAVSTDTGNLEVIKG